MAAYQLCGAAAIDPADPCVTSVITITVNEGPDKDI